MSDLPPTKSAPSRGVAGRTSVLFLCGVIGVAVVGYFVGINDGVPRESDQLGVDRLASDPARSLTPSTSTILAVNYANMRRRETGPTSQWKPSLDKIPQPKVDLFAEIKPTEAEKQQSTLTRASRRAYNGAPPVIPHSVENTTDSACYACHGNGMQIDGRVANRMSHEFLANCKQCHALPPPSPFTEVDASVENSFVGLPAPMKGERAYPGAPPTIPHSTWMRSQCLACHGNESGWKGLQSTHPWRINCKQCHAPSAKLNQVLISDEVGFLPGPKIGNPSDKE